MCLLARQLSFDAASFLTSQHGDNNSIFHRFLVNVEK